MIRTLLAALLAAVAVPAFAAPALPDADPAMWVVKDKDTTIYLFGTFHALDGKSEWFNDEVRQAFDRSDQLVIETILPEDPAAVQAIVGKYALSNSATPLRVRLSPTARKALAETLAANGAPPTAFDKFKPYFAAMALAMIPAGKMGLTADSGTEAVLRKAAKTAGKPVGSLETPDFQFAMFDRISDKGQIEGLEQTLEGMDEVPAFFRRMLTAWNSGDAAGFKALMDESNATSPEAYKVIFSDRNATWAQWIDDRLDRPGTIFLAVGTGHLAGADSVPALLAGRGIAVRRVPAN